MTAATPNSVPKLPTNGKTSSLAKNATTKSTTKSTQSLSTLSNNFGSFLKLLTTQLQNQDPLSPMKTHEFTNQLVMFAEAEQAIATNSKLDSLIKIGQASEASQALSYHGKEVRIKGNQLSLMGDSVNFQYTAPSGLASGEIVIRDSANKVVFKKKLSPAQMLEGVQNLSWDGRNDYGYLLPNGLYKFSISARDKKGNPVSLSNTTVTGAVRGVEYKDGKTWLDMGFYQVPLNVVSSITTPGYSVEDQTRALKFVGTNVHITGATTAVKNGRLSLSYNTAGQKGFKKALAAESVKKVELKLYDVSDKLQQTYDVTALVGSDKLQLGEKRFDLLIPGLTDGSYKGKLDVQFQGVEGSKGSVFKGIPMGYSGNVRRVVFQNGQIRLEVNGVLYDPKDVGSVVSENTPIYKLTGLTKS